MRLMLLLIMLLLLLIRMLIRRNNEDTTGPFFGVRGAGFRIALSSGFVAMPLVTSL